MEVTIAETTEAEGSPAAGEYIDPISVIITLSRNGKIHLIRHAHIHVISYDTSAIDIHYFEFRGESRKLMIIDNDCN